MKDYFLDIEFALDLDNIKYICKVTNHHECELCEYHLDSNIEVHLKDGRYLVYDNESDIADRFLIGVGKKHWLINSYFEIYEENSIFSDQELDSLHI